MSLNNPYTNFPCNEAGLVGNFIGTAYDTVKAVYDNLPEIQRLDAVLAEIPTLAEDRVAAAIEEAMPGMTTSLIEIGEQAVNAKLAEEVPRFLEEFDQKIEDVSQVVASIGDSVQLAEASANASEASAVISTNQANLADISRYAAETARIGAESARDYALSLSGIYADTATGLLPENSTPGQVFGVPVANDISSVILYENLAGVAVDTGARLPSTLATAAVAAYAVNLVIASTAKLRNLFDKSAIVPGVTISVVNGTEAANASYFATGYVPVLGGGTVTFNRANSSNSVFGYAFYDYKKKFISGMPSTTVPAGTAIAVPAGAAYIRGTFTTVTNTRFMMAVNGSTMPVDFIDFELPEDLRTRKTFSESQARTLGILNIFDRTAITDDSILLRGVVSELAGYYITPYMEVVQNSQITFNKSSGLSADYGVHFYDKDFVYISVSAAPVEAVPVVVPAGAAFARTTFRKATVPAAALMVVRGSTLPALYSGFGIPSQDETLGLARNVTRSYARPLSLFDSALATDGFLLGAGGVPQTSANYAYTGYMPVLSGGEITVGAEFVAGTTYGMHFYDKNKAFLSSIPAPFTAGQVMAVPVGAFYARCSLLKAKKGTFFVLDGNVSPLLHYTNYLRPTVNSVKRWANQNFAFFGDSITDAGTWNVTLCNYLYANLALDVAQNGSRMRNAFDLNAAGKQATTETIAPIDVAVCFYGTNDFGIGTPLGAITDSSSAGTFYGDTRKFFETLLGWKPTIKIVMLTPLKRTSTGANSAGFTLLQYVDAIIQVSAEFSAPVLDLNRKSGLNAINMTTWLYDGLHPTTEGQTAIIAKPAMGFFDGIG